MALSLTPTVARLPVRGERERDEWSSGEKLTFMRNICQASQLTTPEIEYENWKEFVELVYKATDDFCKCLSTAVLMDENSKLLHMSPVLGRMHWFPLTINLARKRGPDIIMGLTKQNEPLWCQAVSNFLCTRAISAATIFEEVYNTLGIFDEVSVTPVTGGLNVNFASQDKMSKMTSIMQQEVRQCFSGASPFGIYSMSLGFVSGLLVKNFTFYTDDNQFVFSCGQFQNILLLLAMGLHQRLGERSPLLSLDNDIFHVICATLYPSEIQKHLVFHESAKWLY
jgi:hypothetical protein